MMPIPPPPEDMKLAFKCKLNPESDVQHQQLLDAMETFNNACNWISNKAFQAKTFNRMLLQQLVYYEVKQKYNLSSQMAILAIRKVSSAYAYKRTRNKLHHFTKHGSIDYDTRNFTLKNNNTLSLMVLGGRIKLGYQSHKNLQDLNLRGQCELLYDKIKKSFFINFIFDKTEQIPLDITSYIGVDMGINNLAVTSDGEFYSGTKVEQRRKNLTSLKVRLQRKKTKSAKRHLRRISKKEHRYKKDINHCISKKIVLKAKALGVGVKLEDLKFSKKTVKKFNKQLRDSNAKLGKWAFGQLREYIIYKAKVNGVPVLLVNPAYTSQTCSVCGHCEESNRSTQEAFKCNSCGYEENADLNASINISRATINLPNVVISSAN